MNARKFLLSTVSTLVVGASVGWMTLADGHGAVSDVIDVIDCATTGDLVACDNGAVERVTSERPAETIEVDHQPTGRRFASVELVWPVNAPSPPAR